MGIAGITDICASNFITCFDACVKLILYADFKRGNNNLIGYFKSFNILTRRFKVIGKGFL